MIPSGNGKENNNNRDLFFALCRMRLHTPLYLIIMLLNEIKLWTLTLHISGRRCLSEYDIHESAIIEINLRVNIFMGNSTVANTK
jgi:hypothetical protein